jgi:hypothetical protein
MSSDYRPRSGNNSGGPSRPRRRRGGRNRNRSQGGEHRAHSNGTSAPAKKESPITKLFGWLTGKKKKPAAKSHEGERAPRPEPAVRHERSERPEHRDRPPREPRAERPRREEQEITPQEISTPKLYVGNLSYDAAESDLFDLFSKIGAVKNVEVAMDRNSNRSKGFGFVEMETLDTAKEASAKLNRTDFMGRQIVVSGAKMERRSVNNRDADGGETPVAEI